MNKVYLAGVLIMVLGIFGSTSNAQDAAMTGKTAHDFSFQSIDGQPLPLSGFKGKTVLVVNTASRCGFTKQYDDLQKLYADYEPRGLVVLGVPSNDFGNQEPGSESDIKKFCETNFNITFPMTEKAIVSGDTPHPFYAWIKSQGKSLPKWNFTKYLISPEGKVVDSFGSMTSPSSKELRKAVEENLPAKS